MRASRTGTAVKSAVQPEESWALEDLYADDEAFGNAFEVFAEELPGIGRWQGRLAESAGTLAGALEELTEARRSFARLRCYALLRSDADLGNTAAQALRRRVELLSTEFARVAAYVGPEILALEPEVVSHCLKDEPRLGPFAHFLGDLMRQRAHVLSPAEERLMAESSLLTGGPGTLFEVLNDLELPRPEITLRPGETVRLTPVEFQRRRSGRDRQDRQRVFDAYFGAYAAFRETLTQNVYAGVKTHLFHARARAYPSSLAAALDEDNVPTSVYRNLIEQVRARLPVLHRYLKLRARFLGLERLTYADLHCPLTDTASHKYDPGEARRLLLDGLAPLGQPYVADVERAFVERWIDWRPAAGKRSGAYATGWAYDVHPYVLLNYVGDYESVSTLAHEIGHAMHSYYSNRRQPFATADYSIFVAEVASTLNETLLNHQLRAAASTDGERLALLTSYLDGIRGTLFRQAMFAEFELALHEQVEAGNVLTADSVDQIYLGLLRDYHGHDDGVVEIDDTFAIEWAAIPHMYYGFYVYQYATGIVAATALAEALRGEPEAARSRYQEFLSSGGSDYPLELLRRAGVDLESQAPYDDAFATIGRQLDSLESLVPD